MKRSEAFPSRYIGKDDLKQPVQVVIKSVVREEMPGDEGETENVMYFENGTKPLIVNVTNWLTCENALGDDSDLWIGKTIELYWDATVMNKGQRVGGKRIRIPTNTNGNGNGNAPTMEDLKALRLQLRELGVELRTINGAEVATAQGLQGVYNEHKAILTAKQAENI